MGLKEYTGELTGKEQTGIILEGQRYYITLDKLKEFINPKKKPVKKVVK